MDLPVVDRPFRDHEFIVSQANGWGSQLDGVAAVDLEAGDCVYLRAAVAADPEAEPPVAAVTGGYAPYIDGLTADEQKTVAFAFSTVKAGEGVSVLDNRAEYNSARVTLPEDPEVAAEAIAALEAKYVFGL